METDLRAMWASEVAAIVTDPATDDRRRRAAERELAERLASP
jgi:hypothetical protein